MSETPKVIIANNNLNHTIQQDYTNLIIENNNDNIPTAEFFNNCTNKYDNAIYGFLDSYHSFAENTAISKIVHIIITMPNIVGVYSDNYIEFDKTIRYNHVPAFSQLLLCHTSGILNVPLFMCLKSQQTFDIRFKQLYFYNFLLSACQQYTFYHIAEPLIHIYNRPVNIEQDLQMIRNKYAKTK